MSISFACPECKAQIEVAEEYAGHAGQCPRCHYVLVIPAPNQPAPILATVEATQDFRAIGLWNTWPIVGNDQLGPVATNAAG